MILNVEIRKRGEGYAIVEQTASDHTEQGAPVFEGPREAVENWLAERGTPQADVARALELAKEDSGSLLEVNMDYSESEEFPRL